MASTIHAPSSSDSIRVLVINPNTSTHMTDALKPVVYGLGFTGVEYSFYTCPSTSSEPGIPSINSPSDASASASHCLPSLKSLIAKHDCFLVACYSQHPLVGSLKQMIDCKDYPDADSTSAVTAPSRKYKYVTGIFEASISVCLNLTNETSHEGFGIVSTGKVWEDALGFAVSEFLGLNPVSSFARSSNSRSKFVGCETTGLNASKLHDLPAEQVKLKMMDATKCLLRAGMTGTEVDEDIQQQNNVLTLAPTQNHDPDSAPVLEHSPSHSSNQPQNQTQPLAPTVSHSEGKTQAEIEIGLDTNIQLPIRQEKSDQVTETIQPVSSLLSASSSDAMTESVINPPIPTTQHLPTTTKTAPPPIPPHRHQGAAATHSPLPAIPTDHPIHDETHPNHPRQHPSISNHPPPAREGHVHKPPFPPFSSGTDHTRTTASPPPVPTHHHGHHKSQSHQSSPLPALPGTKPSTNQISNPLSSSSGIADKPRPSSRVKAICLGCAGMVGLDTAVREACILELGEEEGSKVRIVDGVKAGVGLLVGMARGGY